MVRLYAADAETYPALQDWLAKRLPNDPALPAYVDAVARASGAPRATADEALRPVPFSPALGVARIAPLLGRRHPTLPIAAEISETVVRDYVANLDSDWARHRLITALLVAVADRLRVDGRPIVDDVIQTEVFGAPVAVPRPAKGQLSNRTFPGTPMLPPDLTGQANALGVSAQALWTVMHVEVLGVYQCGFDSARRPQILFERHKFSTFTHRQFDAIAPDISNQEAGGYGAHAAQYGRLARAYALAPDEALRAASWGAGQVLGDNYAMLGDRDVTSMVARMIDSEAEHVQAMCAYIRGANLADAMRDQDWHAFAKKYNGPKYASHNYHGRLADTFAKISAHGLPDLELRAAQMRLMYLGIPRGPIDGEPGAKTTAGLRSFQARTGLAETGELNDETTQRLAAEVEDLIASERKSLIP